MATEGGSRNVGGKPKSYSQKLKTIQIKKPGESHQLRIPEDTMKYCKNTNIRCYLYVFNKDAKASVPEVEQHLIH